MTTETGTEADPFQRFWRDVDQLETFVEVTLKGFSPDQFVAGLGDLYEEHERQDRVRAYVEREERTGHHYLFCLASSQLWALLEAWAEDFTTDLLERPSIWKKEAIKKLEGGLVDFAEGDAHQRARILFAKLEASIKRPSKERHGIGRFQCLFDALEFSGDVPIDIKDALFELCQVRHNVAHKGGYADEKFLEECKSIPAKLRERIPVKMIRFAAYSSAAKWYVSSIIRRFLPTDGSLFAGYTEILDRNLALFRNRWNQRDKSSNEIIIKTEDPDKPVSPA